MSTENKLSHYGQNTLPIKTIGLIVNPVAGMGGAVGLKGTDGQEIVNRAKSLGAKPIAPVRAEAFLSKLKPVKHAVQLIVGAGSMGGDVAKSSEFAYKGLGERKEVV